MQIVIDVPQEAEERVITAFCTDRWDEDSEFTQEEFVHKLLVDYVNAVVTDYERAQAQAAAAQQTPDPVI